MTRAPAKLTWSLRVLGARADGYHELDALVTTVSEPHDVVDVAPSSGGITLTVRGASAASVPADASNLAWRAAAAAAIDVAITLRKEIPTGGGLGGGSGDAAAVLRVLCDRFGLDPRRARALAADLGSDVPVCLVGGTARMRGRGDVVEPIDGVASVPVVLACPPIHSSTPAVYAAWDELGGPRAERAVAAPPQLAPHASALVNDLESAAVRVTPALAAFRADLERVVGREALLAGSGSAHCAWFEDPAEARAAADRVERELGVSVWAGRAGAA